MVFNISTLSGLLSVVYLESKQRCGLSYPSVGLYQSFVAHRSLSLHHPLMWLLREQDWLSGESTPLPSMWPGFDSMTRRHMWVKPLSIVLA